MYACSFAPRLRRRNSYPSKGKYSTAYGHQAKVMLGILLLALSLVQLSSAQQADDVDLTLNEQAHGGYDVENHTRMLRAKSISIDDNNIWRHLAYAKPRNGTGKIDRKTFRSTQKCHLPAIKIYCELILTKLNIDWTRVSFSDLRRPLYSELAANLYSLLQYKEKASAPVDTITEANPEPIIKGNNKTLVPALPPDALNVRERRSISTQVRLGNGGFPGEGRIEVFYNGTWGTVCDDGFDVNDARVICSMLGYTGEQPVPRSSAFYGVGIGTIWLDDLACSGTESSVFFCRPSTVGIHNCQHHEDAGVNCHPSSRPNNIRLINGTRAWIGRVEIMVGSSWGTVCDDGFSNSNARVVCRMLGYTGGNPIYRSSAYYGQGTGTIWLDDVTCNGDEQNIFMCRHLNFGQHNCQHLEDVGVDCNPEEFPIPVRLTSSSYPWEGRLEVLYNGMWMSVCSNKFNSYAPRVVCRMLGYTSSSPAVLSSSNFGQGTGSIWSDNLQCTGTEPTLSVCPRTSLGTGSCSHTQDVGIRCIQYAPTPVVRLTCSVYPWEGRVEVWNNGTWGTVCHTNFDVADALVVCRMLGYTQYSPLVKPNALYGPGTGAIWFDGVSCLGTEKTIFQCGHRGLGIHSCSHFEDVGVNCLPTAPSLPLRLVNGNNYWSGRVEVWHNGSWGSVCNVGFDLTDARVVCKMLGYSREQPNIYNSSVYGSGTGYILLSNINCYGSESSLFQCSQSIYGINNCVHAQDVGINCQPSAPTVPVKLANGSFPWEGRVEVWYGGSWGSVCKYNFDATDAGVICSMLGFKGGQPLVHNNDIYGQATGNIWLDNVGCRGTENSIYQCPHNEFGSYTCSVRDVAGINCLPSAPSHVIQLINGTYPWEGRVEVWYNGQWGTICSDSFDIVDAVVVCKMLGFRNISAPTVDKALAYGSGTGVILMDDVSCTGGEKNIYTCSHRGLGVHNCDHYKDVGINCQPSAPSPLVRLVNGSNPWEGRVEVWREGSWGTVCQDNFDVKDALVVCRMMGYTGDDPDVYNNDYGNDNGPIWINDVSCNGSEASIFHCPHNNLENYACEHFDDVWIKCLKNVNDTGPLVNQSPSSSSGTNAVYYVGGACAGIILILIVIIIVLKRNSQGNDNILYDKPEPNSQKVEDTYEDLNERNYNNLAFQASSDDVSRLPNPPQTKKMFKRAQPPPGKGAEGNPKNMSSVCTVDNIYTNTRNASDSGEGAIYQNISQS